MEIKRIEISKMNPAPYNPRVDLKESDAEYQHIKNSLDNFGLLEPIVWNKRTGNIVSGHQRFKILTAGGATEVDAIVVDFDEDKEKACNLAMNKAVGLWDQGKLDTLLAEMQNTSFDMSDFGFDKALNAEDFGEEFDLPDGDKSQFVSMTFQLHEAQAEAIKTALNMVDNCSETFGNENRNGNALYEVIKEWLTLKKSE